MSVIAAPLIAALAVLAPVPAEAQPARARLAYAHGDAVYSIASDGSDRRPIARGFDPAFSPTGDAIALSRSTGEDRAAIWIVAPDGSRAHKLVGGGSGLAYGPAWSPDGNQIAYARVVLGTGGLVSTIEVVRRDGTGRRTVVRLRPTGGLATVSSPVWTPDGQRLLYTRTRAARKTTYGFDIRAVAAAGGGDALFLRDASGGAFSPDGTRLAYADSRVLNGTACGEHECYPNGELAVSGADGSQRRVLLATPADESDPSWSPDGTRIAFASGRNMPLPGSGGEPEIYTITPDGSCLTWLTNGTPGSAYPAWAPSPGDASPPACGAADRRPLIETAPTRSARGSWWLGPRMGAALLSYTEGRGRATTFGYEDCSAFAPRDCLPPFLLSQQDTCPRGRALSTLVRNLRNPRRVRGGAIVFDGRDEILPLILTGRSEIRVQVDSKTTAARERALTAQVVGALRPFGTGRATALPAPTLPRDVTRNLPARLRPAVKSCERPRRGSRPAAQAPRQPRPAATGDSRPR